MGEAVVDVDSGVDVDLFGFVNGGTLFGEGLSSFVHLWSFNIIESFIIGSIFVMNK